MISKRKNRFFRIAKKQAKKSQFPKFRHGAVLVKGGSVISVSENKNQFCSFANRFVSHQGHGTIHAELGCVLGLDNSKTKDSVLYVVRLNNNNKLCMSRPCNMCQNVLRFVGIKKVFYSISEFEYGCLYL